MKPRFRLFRRRGSVFYCFDNATNRYTTLGTRDRHEADQLVRARNQAVCQPAFNRQMGKLHLTQSDPNIATRTWRDALDELMGTNRGATRDRWVRAGKDRAFVPWLGMVEPGVGHRVQPGVELGDEVPDGRGAESVWARTDPESAEEPDLNARGSPAEGAGTSPPATAAPSKTQAARARSSSKQVPTGKRHADAEPTPASLPGGVAYFLKYVEDMCMAKKRGPFAALVSIAQDQQGFFTTKQAIEAGYADNTHPYHVRAGNWERIWRGIYRLRHYPSPEDGDKVAWYLWSRGRDEKPAGVYSHETALSAFDLGDFNPADLHMIVPPAFRRNGPVPKGIVLHRGRVTTAECTRLRGFGVCRPLRAVIDLAKANPTAVEHLRRVVFDARRRGLVTERELAAKRKEFEADALLSAVLP